MSEIITNENGFDNISEIHDIIASANMGIWRIELMDGQEPRMYADDTMKRLLGIDKCNYTPERTYTEWFSNIKSEAVPSVLASVERMQQGNYDENTYKWVHPSKGVRYVRCGGTAQKTEAGYILRGYHYDVDEVIRREKEQEAKLKDALEDRKEYYATLSTLEGIFYSLHVIDLIEDTATEFNSSDQVRAFVNRKNGARDMMPKVMSALTVDEHKEKALEFTDLNTLPDRMKDKKVISTQLIGTNTGWFLANFITMEKDESGRPTKVVYATRVIEEEKRQEEMLVKRAETDEMTGLLNRRAYEEDIYEHNDTPSEDDFVYVSIDVNGLKVVNDTRGHMAGDELLIGACECMKKCLEPYGKLYRIGGDEFVAILYTGKYKTKEILEDFEEALDNWSGELVDHVSVSFGCASKEELPEYSVRQLGALAEQRMYEAKDEHYRKEGVDRRGQKDAHKALYELYTKILKINVTDDTYGIVNVDVNEQTEEKGYAATISGWLRSFGEKGFVHPEDLDEYYKHTDLQFMREYFAEGNTTLIVLYRRKYEDSYKKVMMEIIPATDYTDDNQSLFLYVKNIEK